MACPFSCRAVTTRYGSQTLLFKRFTADAARKSPARRNESLRWRGGEIPAENTGNIIIASFQEINHLLAQDLLPLYRFDDKQIKPKKH